MAAMRAFRKGWVRSVLYWQVLGVLFLVNLLAGLVLAAIPAAELLGPAHYTAIQDAAAGVPAWMAIEILFNPVGNLGLQAGANSRAISPFLQTALVSILVSLVLLPALSWIPGSLVSGGLLLTYTGSLAGQPRREGPGNSMPAIDEEPREASTPERQPFSWKRFFEACWRYWGAFLLLGLVQTLLSLLVIFPLLVVFLILVSLAFWSAILLVPAFLWLIVLWTGFIELGQVYLVAGERRGLGVALRSALRLLRQRMGSLTVYYLLSLGLLLAIHLVFRAGLFPHLPLAFWPLVLIFQQAFVFLRLWARASRLAGDVEFVKATGGLPSTA
jgi:hypothetical protein